MDKIVQIAGRTYHLADIDRDQKMTLREQEECLQEDYEGYSFISVSHGKIRFYYLRKKEGVA